MIALSVALLLASCASPAKQNPPPRTPPGSPSQLPPKTDQPLPQPQPSTSAQPPSANLPTSQSKPRHPPHRKRTLWDWMFFWRKPRPPAALPLMPIGRIFLVNAPANFALIETPQAAQIPTGTLLHILKNGGTTAILRATPQRRPPLLAADLERGLPGIGEPVYQLAPERPQPDPASAPSPSTPNPAQQTAFPSIAGQQHTPATQQTSPSTTLQHQTMRDIIRIGLEAARAAHTGQSSPQTPPQPAEPASDAIDFTADPLPDLPLIQGPLEPGP